MRAYLKAMLIAGTSMGIGGTALAQSSSPFSGWFGGGDDESPVDFQVNATNNDEDLEKTVKNGSLISGALAEDRITGQDLLASARGDYARILGTLYDQGHYSAVINITLDGVEAAEIAPLDAPEIVRNVTITVDPGPEFLFSRAGIAPVAPKSEIPSEYAVGENAGSGTIKSAAVAAVDGWRNIGHAKANVAQQEIVADHNINRVDSQIGLDPGPAVTFGKLNMTGYQRMKPRRLHKMAGYPEGERFDPEELETVRERLRRTGVFSAVTLDESEVLGPNNSMDINLTVVEQKPRRIGAGFEISNTDGAMVSAYWMHRNLFGGGERLRVDGKVSDIGSDTSERDLELKFRIDRPATITPDTTAFIETRLERMQEEEYDSDAAAVTVGFNHIFWDRPSDELTAEIALEYEVWRVTDEGGETRFKVFALPMEAIWDKRDEPNNAKHGFYLSGELTPFIGIGDETGNGVRALGEARSYYSFGEDDKFTLAARGRLGTVAGPDIEETPRDYLFFSGGGGSVRGQPYESLGLREGLGADGGMSIASISTEARWQVREKIGLVVFADYGRVWTDSTFSGSADWHAGAGAGVRYNTPIGPLRFDIAAPIDGDTETGDGVQVYLGLGQAF